MAERRMFAKNVVDCDGFASLTVEARLLYFYIGMYADDDGFNGQVKRLARSEGIDEAFIAELVDAGFLIRFDSGIYLVRHWHANNQIQKDRYHETNCLLEKSMVLMPLLLVTDKLKSQKATNIHLCCKR